MKKTHLPELTVLFTCRVDSRARLANIRASLRYYLRYTDARIMLLEADEKPQLSEMMSRDFPEVEYLFVEDNNPVFHRTRYLNEQMRRVKTANSANIDVDTIVPIAQLAEANARLLRDDEAVMVLPYDGRFVCQDAWRSDVFRRDVDIRVFEQMAGGAPLMFGYISVGGAYVVNVGRYRRCGWENENFPGWGPEDYERVNRLDILGHKPERISGVIYHMEHPRGANSCDMLERVVMATKREYCRICSMTPAELRAEVATWPWS